MNRRDAYDLKQIFFTNILLLGFDWKAEEARNGIPFNGDMFVHQNKKGMEVVLYFLFCNLDAKLAFQEFRDCWPVRNKKMEQEFQKSCLSWLNKIAKEEPDSSLPRIGRSLFLSPGGDRFYEMLFYFSSYVLRKVMVRDYCPDDEEEVLPHFCKKTAKMPKMRKIASRAMEARIVVEQNRFFEEVQCYVETQEQWKAHAMSQTKEYRKLCKEKRELERKLNLMGDNTYMQEKAAHVEETESLRRTLKLQEVRSLWTKLEAFYEKTKEKRAILNEILENNEPNFQLDGASIQLQIPELLTTKYEHAIQMRNIPNTYKGGKLNLTSLIQLAHLSFFELKEKIIQEGVPNFEQSTPSIKNELRTHGAYLAEVKKLRTSLQNDFIPKMKESVESLKESIESLKEKSNPYLDRSVHSPVLPTRSLDFGLGLLPTTPSPAFATAGHVIHSGDKIPEISLKKTARSEATPDVIENLTTSVRELVVRGNQQSDEREFPSEALDSSTIDESATPKPFASKIPKPMNRRLQGRTLDVTSHTSDDQHHSSARNVLAEKIAAAVFSDELSNHTGSSQNSSRENTPKDIALADPLGNISDAPFKSKDLIARTPAHRKKLDTVFSDLASDEDTPASVPAKVPALSFLDDIPGDSAKSVVEPTNKISPGTAAVIRRYQEFKKSLKK